MPDNLPLLLFPTPTTSARETLPPAWPNVHLPNGARQVQRLTPRFAALQAAADARRLELSTNEVEADPDYVLVLETLGSIEGFLTAVKRTAGVEWLLESDSLEFEPDDDFYAVDKYGEKQDAVLPGRLFLLGTNRSALSEVVRVWKAYEQDPDVVLPHGMRKWRTIFSHLKDVRFWSPKDRIPTDVRQYWADRLESGEKLITFEIEAWCFASDVKNESVAAELASLVQKSGGKVLARTLISAIAYHGFLVEFPREFVENLLTEAPPGIVLAEQIMFFRPRGQSLSAPIGDDEKVASVSVGQAPAMQGAPVAALLDGFPLQNHPLLAGRLTVDDPDNFEADYKANERSHGTSMASLIVLGELDGARVPIGSPLYVRPIMRPDPDDFRDPRAESTPRDQLLIDLVHRAVVRLYEPPAVAPSIRVINLSIGDSNRVFDRALSPWARLIDWLSVKYNVLFVVSAGNDASHLTLSLGNLGELTLDQQRAAMMAAVLSPSRARQFLAPAEALNAVTVGAAHSDGATYATAAGRLDLLPNGALACYSRGGRGFRRAVKPDILMPGGRALRLVPPVPQQGPGIQLRLLDTSAPPGHRVAAVPAPDGRDTRYTRGTSNAAALATRAAIQAHAVLDGLRPQAALLASGEFDAVLLKALLVHGSSWGDARHDASNALRLVGGYQAQIALAGAIGYGVADVERAISCTEQRATLLGVGSLTDGEGMEFEAPLPPCLIAQRVKRRLTLTLAWFTGTNPRHAKYRNARLWVFPPHEEVRATRVDCDWRDVRRGTLQHEIFEGEEAFAFVDGDTLKFKVNCTADAGKIQAPVRFAICVSLEVAEGVDYPIYQQVSQRLQARTQVGIGNP